MAETNVKIPFTSDTSGFVKGCNEVKKNVKDLKKTTDGALTSIGNAFGVNTGKIGQMASAIKGLGEKLKTCGNTGGQAIGSLITSMGTLGASIAGLGLAGAIASFKQLNTLAENFGTTLKGISLKNAAEQYKATYKQDMMDSMSGTAQTAFTAKNALSQGWTRAKGMVGNMLAGQSFGEMLAADYVSRANSKIAADAAYQMTELQKQQIKNTTIIAANEAEIATQTRLAKDNTISKEERDEAAQKASALIEQNYKLQANVLRDMVVQQEKINNSSSNTLEDEKRLADLQTQLVSLTTQREQQLAAVDRVERSINKTVKSTSSEVKSMLPDLTQASKEITASVMGVDMSPLQKVSSIDLAVKMMKENKAKVQIPATIIPQATEETKAATLDVSEEIASFMEMGFSSVGSAVGELIGDLATGGDAWTNFGNTAISALGDMAMSVGKVAISTGVATLGIKKALESLNGWVAIAAGTALVALGAAVKTGLSNVASGNYSAASSSGSVASSSYSGSSSWERQMEVKVSGTLSADGNKLVAVLNNENNRRSISS